MNDNDAQYRDSESNLQRRDRERAMGVGDAREMPGGDSILDVGPDRPGSVGSDEGLGGGSAAADAGGIGRGRSEDDMGARAGDIGTGPVGGDVGGFDNGDLAAGAGGLGIGSIGGGPGDLDSGGMGGDTGGLDPDRPGSTVAMSEDRSQSPIRRVAGDPGGAAASSDTIGDSGYDYSSEDGPLYGGDPDALNNGAAALNPESVEGPGAEDDLNAEANPDFPPLDPLEDAGGGRLGDQINPTRNSNR